MKKIILPFAIFASLLLGGCCTDGVSCSPGPATFVTTTSSGCNTCNRCSACSVCSTCGYDASYTYSGWY